ncbi:MAG TPA: amino acid aminotransferase [Paenalcaligenes sp.]|nr:amino acid aminotransferase [Paenalcaligenes sp.]
MFNHLQAYAGDPIFKVAQAFQEDPRQEKINLSIGLYFDDQGQVPVLDVVHAVERSWAERNEPRIYLPMAGLPDYCSSVQALLFGQPAVDEGRIATIQSVGGTGALRVGGELLHEAYPDSELWVSDPNWANHDAIFKGCGMRTHVYRYFDATTKRVDFEGMLSDLMQLPARSIVLLHPCCHNPTGVDLSRAQWQQLIPVLKERQLIPFLDLAYQGFAEGVQEDVYVLRAMYDAQLTFLVANSFSKNFSYYSERCGALSVVCASADEAQHVRGVLEAIVRRLYSNPPAHGAQVVAAVLSDPQWRAQWEAEVAGMRERIRAMRQAVTEQLAHYAPQYDASYWLEQNGMFSYTGLSSEQVDRLRDEFGIYLLASGRVCVPGLNNDNVSYFAQSLAQVV